MKIKLNKNIILLLKSALTLFRDIYKAVIKCSFEYKVLIIFNRLNHGKTKQMETVFKKKFFNGFGPLGFKSLSCNSFY